MDICSALRVALLSIESRLEAGSPFTLAIQTDS